MVPTAATKVSGNTDLASVAADISSLSLQVSPQTCYNGISERGIWHIGAMQSKPSLGCSCLRHHGDPEEAVRTMEKVLTAAMQTQKSTPKAEKPRGGNTASEHIFC